MTIDDKTLAAIVAQAKKNKLSVEIHRGGESVPVYRIPFKGPGPNYMTEGGVGIGRWMTMWGPGSSFKSRMAYEIMAQAQNLPEAAEEALIPRINYYQGRGDIDRVTRLQTELEYLRETFPLGLEIALYNAEQQYDREWAAQLGVDVDRLIIVQSQVVEHIMEVMEGTFATIDMHVVDSTSSASTIADQKAGHGESPGYASDARAWKRSLRKSMLHFDQKRNVGILINQASTNMRTGGMQAQSTRFISHTSSLTLKFETGSFLYERDGVLRTEKESGADESSLAGRVEPRGIEVWATVEKSRICRPMRKARMLARYGPRQFDHVMELVNAGLHFGLLQQNGSWYKAPDANGEMQNVGQGLKKVYEWLEDEDEFKGLIYATLMATLDD